MTIFFHRNNQDVEECTYFREVDPAKNEGLFVWDREPNANFKGTQLVRKENMTNTTDINISEKVTDN